MSNVWAETCKCGCGRSLSAIHALPYCDLDDRVQTVEIEAYGCPNCLSRFIDGKGLPVPVPLPPGTIIQGQRGSCSYCGLPLRSTPLTECVDDAGRVCHVPYFAATCFVCGPLFGRGRQLPIKDECFFSLLRVPSDLEELWQIDQQMILASRVKVTGGTIRNICYSPESKQLLFAEEGYSCEHLVSVFSGARDTQNFVFCRGSSEGSAFSLTTSGPYRWFEETYFVLRRLGVPTATALTFEQH